MTLYQQPWRIQGHNWKINPEKPIDRECSDLRRSYLCIEHFGAVRGWSLLDKGSVQLSKILVVKNSVFFFSP